MSALKRGKSSINFQGPTKFIPLVFVNGMGILELMIKHNREPYHFQYCSIWIKKHDNLPKKNNIFFQLVVLRCATGGEKQNAIYYWILSRNSHVCGTLPARHEKRRPWPPTTANIQAGVTTTAAAAHKASGQQYKFPRGLLKNAYAFFLHGDYEYLTARPEFATRQTSSTFWLTMKGCRLEGLNLMIPEFESLKSGLK